MNDPVSSIDALACVLLLIFWLRGPISRAARAGEMIATELRRIADMADRNRRG